MAIVCLQKNKKDLHFVTNKKFMVFDIGTTSYLVVVHSYVNAVENRAMLFLHGEKATAQCSWKEQCQKDPIVPRFHRRYESTLAQ